MYWSGSLREQRIMVRSKRRLTHDGKTLRAGGQVDCPALPWHRLRRSSSFRRAVSIATDMAKAERLSQTADSEAGRKYHTAELERLRKPITTIFNSLRARLEKQILTRE